MSNEVTDYMKLAEALADALEKRNLWIEGEEYRELVILRMRLSNRVDSLSEELKVATARIAELEDAQRWIPVSERLPDTGITLKYYDVILEGEDSVAVALWDGWYKNWSLYKVGDGYVSTTLVTHWRERPTPPEVQE